MRVLRWAFWIIDALIIAPFVAVIVFVVAYTYVVFFRAVVLLCLFGGAMFLISLAHR